MKRPALMLVLIIGLVAASLAAVALRPAVLGLDLQGGVEVVLEGRPSEQSAVTPQAIARSVEIIRSRVDSFGVAEPEIQTQGATQIAVSLPGASNPDQVVRDLIKPAQLRFINFERNVADPAGETSLYAAVQLASTTTPGASGAASFYVFDKAHQPLVKGAAFPDAQSAREALPGSTLPAGAAIVKVPQGVTIAHQDQQALRTRASTRRTYFVFSNNPSLGGADVTGARSTIITGIGGNQRVVTLAFTGAGRAKFADATRQLAVDGSVKGGLQHFAIILDGNIVSLPTIDYQKNPGGIGGSSGAEIDGDFSQASADSLARQINSGALPIELKVVSMKQVSATLGKQSLRQGLVAGIVGLVLVMLFLIGYYRFLGLIAAAALLVYAALLYAVVVLVPITLTLPGIAGIILTIGVASDANVVIFERVREEARAGKAPRAAILAGYKRGIGAIVDANVVTLATALILFIFATAGVKGFAFTLFVGVLLSLFTAVVATRAAFGVLANRRFLRNDRLLGLGQREIRWKLDFVGKWRLWMAISLVPLLAGAIWIGVNGLKLGLDFQSGTQITTAFVHQPSEDAVRQVFTDLGYEDAKVQSTTETLDGQVIHGFQMETTTLQPAAQVKLERELDQRFGINKETYQLDLVGPTFGRQIVRNAIWAIALSFLVIIGYLSIRFEYKLALPALLSVIHDVWLAISIYAVTGHKVTSATVAALLTILGYSLYDVVIVFDRIRENVPLMRKATYRQIVNTSVHEVLTRSIITSGMTLLPLAVLYFFGGDTLKDFAFALLVGILSGGVSSIAIAAPLAALWKEREPKNKRRALKASRGAATTLDADILDVEALARGEAALGGRAPIQKGGPAVGSRGSAVSSEDREARGDPPHPGAGESNPVGVHDSNSPPLPPRPSAADHQVHRQRNVKSRRKWPRKVRSPTRHRRVQEE